MADIVWPATLQQLLQTETFSYQMGDTSIRSANDVGPAKVRRRSTKGVDTITASILVNATQYQALYDFYDIDLNGGVNQFLFTHPITQAQISVRFTSAPAFRPIGGLTFEAAMNWEVMP